MNSLEENNEINKKSDIFQKFHEFLINKSKTKKDDLENDKDEENNIYFNYLKNPNIIFQSKGDINNNNLIILFKTLKDDIDNGNNIILPFLDICQNLVKAYIESDMDDIKNEEGDLSNEKGETPCEKNNKSSKQIDSLYQIVFKKLRNNCFIHKQIIRYIYEYFSNIYHKVHEKDDDKSLKKIIKMINLFKIFYEKESNENKSSICSLGGNIKIELNNKIKLSKGYQISLNINILRHLYNADIIKNFYLIKINDIEEKYGYLLKNIENQILKSVNFNISSNTIDIQLNTNKKEMKISLKVELDEIQDIYFFENFFGQFSSIEVLIRNNENKIIYNFLPISIRNEDNIYYFIKNMGENIKEISNIIPKIIICDKNLIKINYLNYNDKSFDIVNYFGGVIQFLPFYQIFNILKDKNLNEGVNKIKESNIESMNKTIENTDIIIKEYINDLASFIIIIIIKQLLINNNRFKYFKKYVIFVFYLILNLDLDLNIIYESIKGKIEENNKNKKLDSYIEFLISIYYTQKNSFDFNSKCELNDLMMFDDFKKSVDLSIFKMPKRQFNHIYKHYMKKLFVFNNFWSKNNIFYNNENIKQVKYKQINYYTKNFQLPYLYPILEISKYFPKFSQLRDGIFAGDDNNILNYDFELKEKKEKIEIINVFIKKDNNIDNIFPYEKCCLVKNTHHVKGIIKINKNNNNKNFECIFQSQ